MNLATPVEKLFMVGPTYARRLKRLGIETVEDLLYHFPFRYIDYSLVSPIRRVQPGEVVTVRGEIISMKNEYTTRGKKIQKGKIADQSGEIEVVWFNQPFLVKTLRPGLTVSLSGKADWFGRKIVMVSPEHEIFNRVKERESGRVKGIHTGRLVPVYHETRGVSSKWLRSQIVPLTKKVVPEMEDFLPTTIREKNNLVEIKDALEQIHFPDDSKKAQKARKRFAFEELFLIHLAALQRKKAWQGKKLAYKFIIYQEKILEFTTNLPFKLTKAQKRVLRQIFSDIEKNKPMNRLLEGDVGSGKTVVAAAAIWVAYLNGVQSALMAPTEILAHQHYKTLNQVLTPLGVKIALLTGATKKNSKFDVIIGTHALIHKRAKFTKLGLVVIDEQHRFGVEQRGELIRKGKAPHLLTMTATPIPRTIVLTLYGDLDLSVIDEMPPGRKEVKTWVVPPHKRTAAYDWIRKQVKDTPNQAFIICPLIEESLYETLQSVKAVTTEFKRLQKDVFPDLKLGLLHGRLKSKEKNAVLEKFKKGKLEILVSTPVVEVGIDIPTATIMMIEGAERFGLAQLHQLRGRVGRGPQQSYCLLFTKLLGKKIIKRLKALERTNIGMKLAELDLQMRGPGEIYGTAQHGFFDLKIASFTDLPLIEQTRKAASQLITQHPRLKPHPLLQAKLKAYTIKTIEPN